MVLTDEATFASATMMATFVQDGLTTALELMAQE